MLMKRDHPGGGTEITRVPDEQDDTMPVIEIEKKARALWETGVTLVQKQHGCNLSRAIDIAQRDPVLRQAYDLAKNLYLAKMGEATGFAADGINHGDSSNAATIDPHPTVRTDVGEGENDPSSARHVSDGEAFKAYTAAVKEAAAQGMRASDAHDYVRKTFPKLWAKVKALKGDKALNEAGALDHAGGRSRTMLPLSED